jgi:beta-phosphoglucomutase-like phosphatase (HAD superfamily)
MQDCSSRRVRLGIATTTSRSNVEALLRAQLGADWQDGFDAIVCGEDVARKKPDPAVYLEALRRLGIGPDGAVAVEDSPAGVAAARAAGIGVVVTRSVYFAHAAIDGALATGPGLQDVAGWQPEPSARRDAPRRIDLDDLSDWHARRAAFRPTPPEYS